MNGPEKLSPDESNMIELDLLASAAYFQKNDLSKGVHLLDTEISRNPTNETLLSTAEQIYISRSMFSNALAVTDRRLNLSANDPKSLFTKGYICNRLKRYNDAIASLNKVLAIQSDNNDALLQRADAYLGISNLDAARADFEKVRTSQTNSSQAAFGLGEISWRQHNTNEAIRNLEIYLANAPTNTPQAKAVIQRLRELKQPEGDK